MAIKVPDEIVFYLENDAQSERLLCWIPPRDYENVATDQAALKRLRRNYPRGIEIRMNEKELEQEGIKLEVKSEDLKRAYHRIQADHGLPGRGMVNVRVLIREGIQPVREASETDDSFGISPDLVDGRSIPLSMTGDEEPPKVFKRLSVRQMAKK